VFVIFFRLKASLKALRRSFLSFLASIVSRSFFFFASSSYSSRLISRRILALWFLAIFDNVVCKISFKPSIFYCFLIISYSACPKSFGTKSMPILKLRWDLRQPKSTRIYKLSRLKYFIKSFT